MARKKSKVKPLTQNQQAYKRQIRRIRGNLTKLAKEGYNIDEMLDQFTYKLPNRVTALQLENLRRLTPTVLRHRLDLAQPQVKKPLPTLDETTTFDMSQYMPEPTIDTGYTGITEYDEIPDAEAEWYMNEIRKEYEIEKKDTEEFTEFAQEPEPEPEPEYWDYEIPEEEEPEREPIPEVDLENGQIIYHDPITWEVVSTAPLAIDVTDDTVNYVDAETGEVISSEPRTYSNSPDLSEMAVEYLKDLISGFSPQITSLLNDIIDKMIADYGMSSVAEAFANTISDSPNLAQRISNAKERYGAMRELFGELAERLPMTDAQRDELRDMLTRESLANMEEYI